MPSGTITCLISSVPFESRLLLGKMRAKKRISPEIHAGTLGNSRVVHITSGMGIANAAHAATVLMERFSPAELVLFGIGGAYHGSGLRPGGLAVAESETYADAGVLTGRGLVGFEHTGIPLLRHGRKEFYNTFEMDSRMLRRALKKLDHPESGVFLTVCAATGTRKRGDQLRRRFGAVCENMEGASVAQVCARYGVPMLELRGISNMVEDRDTSGWLKEEAAIAAQEAVLQLLS